MLLPVAVTNRTYEASYNKLFSLMDDERISPEDFVINCIQWYEASRQSRFLDVALNILKKRSMIPLSKKEKELTYFVVYYICQSKNLQHSIHIAKWLVQSGFVELGIQFLTKEEVDATWGLLLVPSALK